MTDLTAPLDERATGPGQAERTEFRIRPAFSGQGQSAVEVLSGPGQGIIHRFDTHLLIGRAARCDLVIDDATVSREHLLIDGRGGRWLALSRNPKNPALKNGVPFQTAPVGTGDTLTLGPARLRLVLSNPQAGLALPPRVRRLLGDRKLLISAGIGIFILLVLLFFLSKPAKTPQEAVVADDWARQRAQQDTEFMNKVSTLLIQARRLQEEGRDDQALARLDALLAIDAGNGEAQRLKAELQTGMMQRSAEDKSRRDQAAQALERAKPHIQQAERLLAAGDGAGARAAAQDALAQAPDAAQVRQLMEKIDAREASDQRQAQEKAQTATAKRQELNGLYDEAAAALADDALYKALLIYRRLGDAEAAEPARAAARKKAAEIQDALVKRVMPDFTAGQKLYNQKKYAEASALWAKVLEIYPEAKETKARLAELTPMLEAEAKRLYEEGLVYEGLGDRQTARARWNAVLETMPLKDNAYSRRAAEKLGMSPDRKGQP
ncbi:hypothetical protein DVDV_0593 [Desulfovibrio sp. DV]|uniref:FHA domain-containing protein n=1 Tax=Desulfovibrio sp. DV TaxID=1844708 RepID=UPI00094BB162|nr:FHA domain-containing protein [Desulfovibrio sp. DV]OLN30393.1 hypothetical protein DVDV_0593 [Desulfovibrio sp. DV]